MDLKLKKRLNGRRNNPINLFGMMDPHLAIIGFRPVTPDTCVCAFEDATDVVVLTPYVDEIFILGRNEQLLNKVNKYLMDRFEMTEIGDTSKVVDMNVIRDRENGTITIDKKDHTEDVVERFSMKDRKGVFTSGARPERSLNQPETNLLGEEGERQYHLLEGATMYLAQDPGILYTVNQFTRGMFKPPKAHIVPPKYLLRYVSGSTDFSITHKQGGLKIAAFADVNRGKNPDDGKSTSSYIVMLASDVISLKVGLEGLLAQ